MAKSNKYYVFEKDGDGKEAILGYADGYAWIPTSHSGHHRLGSHFLSSAPQGTKQWTADLEVFLKGIFGSVDKNQIEKLAFLDADQYYAAAEDALVSPWALAQSMIESGARRILLYGPPGVGKSYTPWSVARRLGAAFHSVTLTDMTPMAELRGHFVIKGMDTVWHDGILSRAWRDSQKGRTIMVLNEIDHVGADAESFLHNFLDDPEMARVYLPTGEELVPGEIQVVATMNGIPDDLADALRDRFTVRVEIKEPHPDALKGLPAEIRDFAKRMIMSPPKGEERMSLRAFYDLVNLVKGMDRKSGSFTQACRAMFGARGDDVAAALRVVNAK